MWIRRKMTTMVRMIPNLSNPFSYVLLPFIAFILLNLISLRKCVEFIEAEFTAANSPELKAGDRFGLWEGALNRAKMLDTMFPGFEVYECSKPSDYKELENLIPCLGFVKIVAADDMATHVLFEGSYAYPAFSAPNIETSRVDVKELRSGK